MTEVEQGLQHTVYMFDGFQLDVTRRKLISSGGLVQSLNSRAMDALLLLVENSGELIEKRRLMQTVWPNSIVEDNNLNQCVLAIRKALGEAAGSNRYIMTVPGRGYRFVCPVREVSQESFSEASTVPALRQRPSQALWLGIAGTTSALLLAILLQRIGREHFDAASAVFELLPPEEQSAPAIVLRLHEIPVATGRNSAASSTAVLAQCLAARPDIKLNVQVQLATETGVQVWAGSYLAGVQDPLTLQLNSTANATGCRDLIAAGAAKQQAVLAK